MIFIFCGGVRGVKNGCVSGGVRGVKNGCIKLPYSPIYFLEEYWTKTIKRVEKTNK